MNCDPNTLMAAAKCFKCIPKKMLPEVQIYLLCQWANASATPCVLPGAMTLGAVVPNSGYVSIPLNAGVPPATLNTIVCWGTVPGGPYPNCKTFPFFGPILPTVDVTVADGLLPLTTYYFVAYANSGPGCISPISNEVSGAPLPGPAGFEWTPHAAVGAWHDSGGNKVGDLGQFYATADQPTVDSIDLSSLGITGINNAASLPALTSLNCSGNGAGPLLTLGVDGCTSLTTLDVTNNPNMTALSVTNTALVTLDAATGMGALTTLNVLGCNSLTTLDCSGNVGLTSLDCTNLASLINLFCPSCALGPPGAGLTLTGCISLSTLDCSNNVLTSLVLTGLNIVDLSCYSNSLISLDVTPCSLTISTLDCSIQTLASLVTLDITGCSAITLFNAYSNSLGSITFNPASFSAMTLCDVDDNVLTNSNPDYFVNAILENLAANTLQGGVVDVSLQTPAAPPSSPGGGFPDGIAAVAVLTGYATPWTVLTD